MLAEEAIVSSVAEVSCNLHNRYFPLRHPNVPFPVESIAFWCFLFALQDKFGPHGNLLEVGVEQGGTAFLSILALRADEQQTLIDLKRSERFDEKWALLDAQTQSKIVFHEMNSQDLRLENLTQTRWRFIHLDAARTYDGAVRDMSRYAPLLIEGGVLCVGDFFTNRWPDVTIAILDTYKKAGLLPIALVNRKAYFCRSEDAPVLINRILANLEALTAFGTIQHWDVKMQGTPLVLIQIKTKPSVGREPLEVDVGCPEASDSAERLHSIEAFDKQFNDPKFQYVLPTDREAITKRLEELFEEITDTIHPSVFVEVGAFDASFSRRMKTRYPTAAVYAFEANPRAFEHFVGDVTRDGVSYQHLAIGPAAGSAEIHIPEQIAGNPMPFTNRMASLNPLALRDSRSVSVHVPMLRLDEALRDTAPNARYALWIDVEGAIDQVLDGAAQTLERTDLIFCELEHAPVWVGQKLAGSVRNRLTAAGFQIVARDCQKWFQYNAIFARGTPLDAPLVRKALDDFESDASNLWHGITKPRLFQYWDKPERPEAVDILMRGWQADSAFQYCAYNKETAEAMIRRHFDDRTVTAFRACSAPAMQADFIRLCALYVFGGIYVDADIGNVGKNQFLTRREGRGFLYHRRGSVANDLMVVHNPPDKAIAYALEQAIKNIEERIEGNVWDVTGPGILTSAYNRFGPDHEMFKGFRFGRVEDVRELVSFQWDMEYKKSAEHWTNLPKGGIYTEPGGC